ncbi:MULTISPECIES: hypothetical protein [unclassified Nocardia]|uniref:hypothetical protein n=1 Tax=unclassified Nocardia TaxID=2637762 RepID=UPI0024A99B96|nr:MULTISPECIES: hypothetical protein [unclassified Nocardia]
MRRSPQEKKALSYAKDRRNDYGENDKSSRKNIPRNKRVPNRADRHRERQVMASALGPVSVDAAERAEVELRGKRSKWLNMRWRKHRDAPLGEVVMRTLARRVEQQMNR